MCGRSLEVSRRLPDVQQTQLCRVIRGVFEACVVGIRLPHRGIRLRHWDVLQIHF